MFDEESAYHPSSFRRCVRHLFGSHDADTEFHVRGHANPSITEPAGIQGDAEVDEYLEQFPLLEEETEDQSPTPTLRSWMTHQSYFHGPAFTSNDLFGPVPTGSPPLDLEQLEQDFRELRTELKNEQFMVPEILVSLAESEAYGEEQWMLKEKWVRQIEAEIEAMRKEEMEEHTSRRKVRKANARRSRSVLHKID